MRAILPLALSAFIALPAGAQDFGGALLKGLGAGALDKGSDMLKEAPEGFDRFMQDTKAGRSYPSEADCLGELQVGINAGIILANMLPFSTVQTWEDERGPVGRFRLMLNGERHHLEVSCDGPQMTSKALDWGKAPDPGKISARSSLDAGAGLLLLLHIQGAFEKDVAEVATEEKENPLNSGALESQDIRDPVSPYQSERGGIGDQISECWNIGALSTEAARTTVKVGFSVYADGTPMLSTIHFISSDGGSDVAARQAYEAARRAIIRCGMDGYQVAPSDRENEVLVLSFDPGRTGQTGGIELQ